MDQKMFAPIVKVRSLRWVALREIPKKTIRWNQKKAYPPKSQPSDSAII
jgi:hypothetical protein